MPGSRRGEGTGASARAALADLLTPKHSARREEVSKGRVARGPGGVGERCGVCAGTALLWASVPPELLWNPERTFWGKGR